MAMPHRLVLLGLLGGLASTVAAEDLEPRRWNHLPVGLDVFGAGYAYTEADIGFDPVLQLDHVEMEMHSWVAKYVHTFALFDKSARIEIAQGWQHGRWKGLLSGAPASTERDGLSDTIARFAMNLYGAPPLAGREFAAYRADHSFETIVGAAVVAQFPTGDYHSDRLINLGSNRYTVTPQLGVQHNWGDLSFEYTGSVWFYTDNDDFYGGNTLEKDPLFALQGHLVYHLPAAPKVWGSISGAYTYGGETAVNGVDSDDLDENLIFALSIGFPLYGPLSGKLAWVGSRTQADTGMDSDSLVAAVSLTW
jgi:hypothetical protein